MVVVGEFKRKCKISVVYYNWNVHDQRNNNCTVENIANENSSVVMFFLLVLDKLCSDVDDVRFQCISWIILQYADNDGLVTVFLSLQFLLHKMWNFRGRINGIEIFSCMQRIQSSLFKSRAKPVKKKKKEGDE